MQATKFNFNEISLEAARIITERNAKTQAQLKQKIQETVLPQTPVIPQVQQFHYQFPMGIQTLNQPILNIPTGEVDSQKPDYPSHLAQYLGPDLFQVDSELVKTDEFQKIFAKTRFTTGCAPRHAD